ncbi:hypothetical protein ACINK0_11995 [Deinococcus sp. VB343]|uniref:Uncharacterized protein n=1 Tax=Deinococcus sp. VB142 TaxID=3112952 RepID=A0AAU6Q3H7_9DEIO
MKRAFLLILGLFVGSALARPNPDRLGICYVFGANKLSTRAPCVVGSGYGAGAQYLNLTIEGQEYYAEFPNLRPDMTPTLNGKLALEYERDTSFLGILKGQPLEGEDYMPCIKTKDGKTDVCSLVRR